MVTLLYTWGVRLFVLLCLASAAVSVDSVPAHAAFPSESAWEPVIVNGAVLTDIYGDAKNVRDIVGDESAPAAFRYQDSQGLSLRMRLDDDPSSGGGLKSFGWGVVLEYDGDLQGYDAAIWLNGVGAADAVKVYDNVATDGAGQCDAINEAADLIAELPAGSYRVVSAASSFGGTPDYFLDIFVPWSELAKLPPKNGRTLTPSTSLQLVFGTSNNGTPGPGTDVAGSQTNSCDVATYQSITSDPPGGTVLDTDGDGLPDYWEEQYGECVNGLNSGAEADPDNDGMTNIEEFKAGTNPCDPDSDNDGHDDGDDNCPFVSNADQADLDGDGIGDVCDPDRDGDGIPNGEEDIYGTDPGNADSDGDGLSDGEEILLGTDPNDADTDGDGVADGADNCRQVANPSQDDYDGDGIGDACESDRVPWLGGGAFGCSSSSTPSAMWLMLAALFVLRLRRKARPRRLAVFGVLLAVGLLIGPVGAEALQTDLYRIKPSPMGWTAVESADLLPTGALTAGFFLQYAKDPLVFRQDGEVLRKVISGRLGSTLTGAYGVFDRIEIGAAVPVVIYQTGQGIAPPAFGDEPPALTLQDLELRPRFAILEPDDTNYDLAVAFTPAVLLPTSKNGAFAGNESTVFQPELAVSSRVGPVALAANLYYTLREATSVAGFEQADTVGYRAAAAMALPMAWTATAELLGETSAAEPFGEPSANPLELDLGALYEFLPGWLLALNAGTGLMPGVGAPQLQFGAGVRWTFGSAAGPFAGSALGDGELAKLRGGRIELSDNIHFEVGSERLRSSSNTTLNAIADILRENGDLEIRIVGHTDDKGDPESNLRLSRHRAEAVRQYLARKGIASSRLSVEGRGESEPIAPNTTEEGREKNRRVEFFVE